jgi:hypothetical protein
MRRVVHGWTHSGDSIPTVAARCISSICHYGSGNAINARRDGYEGSAKVKVTVIVEAMPPKEK